MSLFENKPGKPQTPQPQGRFFSPLIQKKPQPATATKEAIPEVAAAKDISVSASHRNYFLTAGIAIFKKNLSNGFSALGAAFSLGQSATESGYGDKDGLAKKIEANNYWGMKSNDKVIKYGSFDKGYAAWQKMMAARFSSAYDLMKKETFTAEEMQKSLNPGKGSYNYDPGNADYARYMLSTAKNVMKRMLVVLGEQIALKKKEGHGLVKEYVDGKPIFAGEENKAKYETALGEIANFQATETQAQESLAAVVTALK